MAEGGPESSDDWRSERGLIEVETETVDMRLVEKTLSAVDVRFVDANDALESLLDAGTRGALRGRAKACAEDSSAAVTSRPSGTRTTLGEFADRATGPGGEPSGCGAMGRVA